MDAVVVGGGIIGCSIAYQLATSGHRVTVIDKGPAAGAGATSASSAIVRFHYSTLDPAGDALELRGRFGQGRAGFASPTLLASYLHLHLGADPDMAARFVAAASVP